MSVLLPDFIKAVTDTLKQQVFDFSFALAIESVFSPFSFINFSKESKCNLSRYQL